jgi:hypothetical protein
MRRLLIIVLLLIFPFQVTLAAVDACCGYSTQARHGECAAEAKPGRAADPVHTLSKVDVHCGMCVLGSVSYLPLPTVLPVKPLVDRSTAAAAGPIHFASYLAPRPDRPQWPRPV